MTTPMLPPLPGLLPDLAGLAVEERTAATGLTEAVPLGPVPLLGHFSGLALHRGGAVYTLPINPWPTVTSDIVDAALVSDTRWFRITSSRPVSFRVWVDNYQPRAAWKLWMAVDTGESETVPLVDQWCEIPQVDPGPVGALTRRLALVTPWLALQATAADGATLPVQGVPLRLRIALERLPGYPA